MAAYDVATANNRLEFDTQNGRYISAVLVDSNHMVAVWAGGASSYGTAQVFSVNTTTWAVATSGNLFLFNGNVFCYDNHVVFIDSTHVINAFTGDSDDGFIVTLAINTTTWAISTAATALEFDTNDSSNHSLIKIDTNHVVLFRQGVSGDGFANVFTVNTTTWAVTTASSPLEFDTQNSQGNGACMLDTNHAINFWGGGASSYAFAQTFTINTTTWAITTAASSLNFNTAGTAKYHKCVLIDATHVLGLSYIQTANVMSAQVFAINTTTWAVSTASSPFTLDDSSSVAGVPDLKALNANHFVVNYCGTSGDGFSQVLTVNTSTWAISTTAASLEFDTADGTYNSTVIIDSNHFVNVWQGSGSDGFIQAFAVELPPSGPANLKTYNTNLKANIKTINTNVIANVKTLNTNA